MSVCARLRAWEDERDTQIMFSTISYIVIFVGWPIVQLAGKRLSNDLASLEDGAWLCSHHTGARLWVLQTRREDQSTDHGPVASLGLTCAMEIVMQHQHQVALLLSSLACRQPEIRSFAMQSPLSNPLRSVHAPSPPHGHPVYPIQFNLPLIAADESTIVCNQLSLLFVITFSYYLYHKILPNARSFFYTIPKYLYRNCVFASLNCRPARLLLGQSHPIVVGANDEVENGTKIWQ